MTTKKVLGYIFIVLSVMLLLAAIGQLPSIFAAIFGFFKVFTGTLDGYGIGYVIGMLIYWVLHFLLMVVLWRHGRKWTRKIPKLHFQADDMPEGGILK